MVGVRLCGLVVWCWLWFIVTLEKTFGQTEIIFRSSI